MNKSNNSKQLRSIQLAPLMADNLQNQRFCFLELSTNRQSTPGGNLLLCILAKTIRKKLLIEQTDKFRIR